MKYKGKVEAVDNCLRRYYDGDLLKEDLDNLFYVCEGHLRSTPGLYMGSPRFWDFIEACREFLKEQTPLTAQILNRTRHAAYGNRHERFTQYIKD